MPRNHHIRVKDLPSIPPNAYPRPLLLCPSCGGEYSAHQGDYFASDPMTVIRCCNRPVRLVRKRTTFETVEV